MNNFILLLCFTTIFLPFISFSQCDGIEHTKDKFTDVESWRTPIYFDIPAKIKVHKHIITIGKRVASPAILYYLSDSARYQVSFSMFGEESPVTQKGVFVIFSNGEKLQFPDTPVIVDYIGYKVSQIAILTISETEANLFKNNNITDIRLGISDTAVDPWIGEKMREAFSCLVSSIKK